jgi:hypothetical protein
MINILIQTLSGHRCDEYLALMAVKALAKSTKFNVVTNFKTADVQLLFNGLNITDHSQAIIAKTHLKPSIYMYDDHALPLFNHMPTISQFKQFGDVHFQLSELALFDSRFTTPTQQVKIFDFCYWGHQKPERSHYYDIYIKPNDVKSTLLIGEWDDISSNAFILPYERSLQRLYLLLALAKWTIIFGDSEHDGSSIPLRVYEALMNGVVPYFSPKLAEGNQLAGKPIHTELLYPDNISLNFAKYHIIGPSLTQRRRDVSETFEAAILKLL